MPIQDMLRRALGERQSLLIDAAMSLPGSAAAARPDIERIMTAFGRVLIEALEGQAHGPARTTFFDTIVPALIGHGQTSREAVFSAVRFGVVLSNALACAIEESRRTEASVWLGEFFASYVSDLATAFASEVAP